MAQSLPRRLRQARAQYQRQQLQLQHRDCERQYLVRGPHLGEYCVPHGQWLRWVPHDRSGSK